MSKELKFKVAADTSQAVAGFEKIGTAAKKTKKEVKEMTSSSKLSKEWKNADKAVSSYAKRLDDATRKTEKLTRQTSKWRAGLASGLKIGGAIAAGGIALGGMAMGAAADRERAVGRLAGTMGDAEGAAGVANGLTNWARKNAADPTELLKHVDRLLKAGVSADRAMSAVKSAVISAAGDASKIEGILEPLTEFASKGFIEEQILDKFAELGVDLRSGLQQQLGLTREQLDKAVADHSITADAAIEAMHRLTAEGTRLHDSHAKSLEGMAGQVALISGAFEELKVNFGTGFAQGVGGTLKAIGNDAQTMSNEMNELFAALGAGFGAVASAIGKVTYETIKAIANVADSVAEFFGGDLMNNNAAAAPFVGGNFTPFRREAGSEDPAETRARRQAAATLAAERLAARSADAGERLQQNLKALNNNNRGARTRADIALAAGFNGDVSVEALDRRIASLNVEGIKKRQARAALLEKELAVLAEYGLTENSTAADISAKNLGPGDELDVNEALRHIETLGGKWALDNEASIAQIAEKIMSDAKATDTDIQKTDEAVRLQGLRAELQKIDEEEKKQKEAVEKQKAAVEAVRVEYERQKNIQDALIAGDEKRAELLTQQAEAEKLAAQYAAKGFDMATAQQMAADEINRKYTLAAKNANVEQTVDPLARNVKLRETISSPLADIGGGGVRIRFYENQQIRAVTDTASATGAIRDISAQILTHLQNNQNKAILA